MPHNLKSANLFKILSLVRSKENITSTKLAKELGVTERTLFRYLAELSVLGFPINYNKKEKSYQLPPNAFFSDVNLTLDEVLALKLASEEISINSGSPYLENLESAFRKIASNLSNNFYSELDETLKQVSIFSKEVANHTSVKHFFALIGDAIKFHKRLEITYYSPHSDKVTVRKFDPYGLAFRHHAWYVIGYCHRKKMIINLRVQNIRKILVLTEKFVMPSNFSIQKYFENKWNLFDGKLTTVKVKFSPHIARLIKMVKRHPSQKIEDLPDGSIIFTVTVEGIEEISWWIMQYGENAEVLEPEELREKFKKTASEMVKIYKRKPQKVKV